MNQYNYTLSMQCSTCNMKKKTDKLSCLILLKRCEIERWSDRSERLFLFKQSQFDHMNHALVIIIWEAENQIERKMEEGFQESQCLRPHLNVEGSKASKPK